MKHLPIIPSGTLRKALQLTALLASLSASAGTEAQQDGVPYGDAASSAGQLLAPISPWLDSRSKRFQSLFFGAPKCDVLVVPVQVEAFGFDLPTRQIMTAELALTLSAADTCIADPYLVDLALGEGMRRYQTNDINALAAMMQATTIVTTYAGQSGPTSGRMRITMQVTHPDTPSGSPPKSADAAHSTDTCTFDDEHSPITCFREQLPKLLTAMGLRANTAPTDSAGKMPKHLPAVPEQYLRPERSTAIEDASNLMFLAMLAPSNESRAATRLFTKAWARLAGVPESNSAARLLRTRIMLHLYQRPYALSLIKLDTSAEADVLRSLLNGNLPAARSAFNAASDPWTRFFLGLEVHDLELEYGRDDKDSKQKVLDQFKDSKWRDLVAARLADHDEWIRVDTLPFKKLLDEIYPIPGFAAPAAAAGKIIVSPSDSADYELFALRHIHKLIEQQPKKFCCMPFANASITPFDLVDLFDSRIEYSLIGHARFQISPQSKYANAIAILEAYDSELAGNPYAEISRASAYSDLLNQGQQQGRDALQSRMISAAQSAAAWSQGQSINAVWALWYLRSDNTPSTRSFYLYGYDYPIRTYWNNMPNSAGLRLAFSTDSPAPLKELIDSGNTPADLHAILESRFIGNAKATAIRLDQLSASERTPDKLRAELKGDPDNWTLRNDLAKLLMETKAYAGIPDLILADPGFKSTQPGSVVRQSNRAHDWGDQLFWTGEFDSARVLLKVAADNDDGSSASVTSVALLGLLDKDYATTAAANLEAARHYSDPRRYDDFLRLMFASGRDRDTWPIFDQVLSRFRAYQVWSAAMTGNRRAGLGSEQLRAWLSSHSSTTTVLGTHDDIARYAFMEQLVDRRLEPDFAEFMKTFSGRADLSMNAKKQISDKSPRDISNPIIGPSQFGIDRNTPIQAVTDVPNRYGLLADAFAKFRGEKYAEAAEAFDRFSAYYDIESPELMFVIPYFSFAAANSGDKFGLEDYLNRLSGKKVTFGVLLGRAVFSAWAQRPEESQESLDRARLKWIDNYRIGDLPSSYVFLDICTQLYEKKKGDGYRDEALRLARTLLVSKPTDAYAPALIAYLGNENERLEALSIAVYLDPLSEWASKAPDELRAKAMARNKEHPPLQFRKKGRDI